MIKDLLNNLFGTNRSYEEDLQRLETDGEIVDFYTELQSDILDTTQAETDVQVTHADVWEVVIREGLYQNLTENPAVAFEFLLISTHGPSNGYQEYLNLATDHRDLICLLAVSALVNDATYREKKSFDGVIETEVCASLGDVAKLEYEAKRTYLDELQTKIHMSDLDFICAKAAHSTNDRGLFDRPLIDLLSTDEELHFYFKAKKHGYATADGSEINPTGNGAAYHLITNNRIMSAVGRKDAPDMVLSISISDIRNVEIHAGWTKERIEIEVEGRQIDDTYTIWVPSFGPDYTESDILAHLEK